MICTPCTQANDIYLCGDVLTIGDVASPGTYLIKIIDNTTGRITMVPDTLIYAGAVTVDMAYFAKDHTFTLSLSQNGVDVGFDIGEVAVDCITFIVRSANGDVEDEQELTIKG